MKGFWTHVFLTLHFAKKCFFAALHQYLDRWLAQNTNDGNTKLDFRMTLR